MAYTSHGHQIIGSPMEENLPEAVMRCGGPAHCLTCSQETLQWQTKNLAATEEDVPKEPEVPALDPQDLALLAVAQWDRRNNIEYNRTPDDFYVSYFIEVLHNWECEVRAKVDNGAVYAIVYDGNTAVLTMDLYVKAASMVVPKETLKGDIHG